MKLFQLQNYFFKEQKLKTSGFSDLRGRRGQLLVTSVVVEVVLSDLKSCGGQLCCLGHFGGREFWRSTYVIIVTSEAGEVDLNDPTGCVSQP